MIFPSDSDDPRFVCSEIPFQISVVLVGVGFRHQDRDVLPQQFVFRITEHSLGCRIDSQDRPIPVDRDDRIRCGVEDRPHPFLAYFERMFRPFADRDVLDHRQPRRMIRIETLRPDRDDDDVAVFFPMFPFTAIGRRSLQPTGRQCRGRVRFVRQQIEDRHSQKLFPGVAVVAYRRAVHFQKPKRHRVVQPHRHRIQVEQPPIQVLIVTFAAYHAFLRPLPASF